jgi:hypothetical protein
MQCCFLVVNPRREFLPLSTIFSKSVFFLAAFVGLGDILGQSSWIAQQESVAGRFSGLSTKPSQEDSAGFFCGKNNV